MKESETEKIEYKRKLTENFPKEVLAFANSDGGSIYIGVEDDGTVTGVSDPDGTMQSIRNMLHDSIHPDIMMFVHIGAEEIDQHTIIHVRVAEGTNKPYYLVKYGLKPSGVFVRQGTASVQASTEQIRQMIKQADGDVFEENISLEQDLSFGKQKLYFLIIICHLADSKCRLWGFFVMIRCLPILDFCCLISARLRLRPLFLQVLTRWNFRIAGNFPDRSLSSSRRVMNSFSSRTRCQLPLRGFTGKIAGPIQIVLSGKHSSTASSTGTIRIRQARLSVHILIGWSSFPSAA